MILAIDASQSKTGWSVLDDEENLIDYGLLKFKTKNKGELFIKYYVGITDILEKYNINEVIFEDQYCKFVNSFKSLLEFRGVILLSIYLHNIKSIVESINATSARKQIVGIGSADKEDVCNFLENRYNIDFINLKDNEDRDITDSIILGLAYIKQKRERKEEDARKPGANRKKTKNKKSNSKRTGKSKTSWD